MESKLELVRSIESALGVSLGEDNGKVVVVVLTTSLAVIVGLVVFLWKRSTDRSKETKPVVVPKTVSAHLEEEEEEVDPSKVKVTVFFGTQTGTAEGFAKVCLKILVCSLLECFLWGFNFFDTGYC